MRVLLIEAGGRDRRPNIKIPAAFANQFHTKLDWDYATEPEPHVDGRSLYIPRGKALGGSSSMNAMLYVRGRPLDYDLWERAGGAGLGLGRRAALLPAVRGQRARRLGVPRRGRRAERRRAALAAAARPAAARRQRRRGHPADRRLQRARAGRRLDVPGHPARRAALERRRRVPAPGAARPNLKVVTGATCRASSWRAGGRSACAIAAPRGEHGAARRARGDPRRGGDRLAADPACSRGSGPPSDLREVGVAVAPRAARRRAQPPGPPVRDRALGGLRGPTLYGADKPEAPRRVAAAQDRAADLDGRRGGRVRPHPRRPARRRHPVPHGRGVLRGPRRARSSTATR